MRQRHACVAITLSLIAAVQPALGAVRTKRATVIQVNHLKGTITVLPGNDEGKLLDTNEFSMRRREAVTVEIADYNPLLFDYDATVSESETEQHKIAAEFAKTLSALMAQFRTGGGSDDDAILIEGLNFGAFGNRLQLLAGNMNSIGAEIAKSLGSDADVSSLKTTVRGWKVTQANEKISDDLRKMALIAEKCLAGIPLQSNAGMTFRCTDPLADATTTRTALREKRARDQEVAAKAATPPERKPLPARREAKREAEAQPLSPISSAAPPAPGSAAPSPGAPTPAMAATGERIIDFVSLVEARRGEIQDSMAVLKRFAQDVEVLHQPKALVVREYSLNTQTIAATIKASSRYEGFLDPSTKARRDAAARKFAIVLQPYSPVSLSLAPALVLLFIENPTFKPVKQGDHLVIQETDDDVTSYNLGAMLNITPEAWSEPTFGGALQVGVSPTKGKIGFYLGGAIHVQQLFSFGGGFTWQQVDKLAAGLTPGQTIVGPDDIKTTTRFRRGGYVHITVSLPK